MRPEFDADFAYHFGLSEPVIAAINGPAAGVGLVLACYADLRFAAAGAKLGLSWLLPRLVGLARANTCCFQAACFWPKRPSRWDWSRRRYPPTN